MSIEEYNKNDPLGIFKEPAMSKETAKQNKWENLTCYCKNQKEVPYQPFGYLTTISNGAKYVTFLRKCDACGKLRGNFQESKPKEEKGVTL